MTDTNPPSGTRPLLLGAYAGFATRAVALIIDMAIITVTLTIIGVIVTLLTPLVQFSPLTVLLLQILQLVMTALMLSGYFIVMWMLSGQTVGQALMGVRVVRTDGSYVTLWVALRRFVGFVLSAILFIGFIWVLWDDRRQGLHDKLGGTFVVYSWAGPRNKSAAPLGRLRSPRRASAASRQ